MRKHKLTIRHRMCGRVRRRRRLTVAESMNIIGYKRRIHLYVYIIYVYYPSKSFYVVIMREVVIQEGEEEPAVAAAVEPAVAAAEPDLHEHAHLICWD